VIVESTTIANPPFWTYDLHHQTGDLLDIHPCTRRDVFFRFYYL